MNCAPLLLPIAGVEDSIVPQLKQPAEISLQRFDRPQQKISAAAGNRDEEKKWGLGAIGLEKREGAIGLGLL